MYSHVMGTLTVAASCPCIFVLLGWILISGNQFHGLHSFPVEHQDRGDAWLAQVGLEVSSDKN